MQADFHYYAIAALARGAGFSKKNALTVAYASQYVDDCTEGPPIWVGSSLFNPCRTSPFGFENISWEMQRKVFIPYHFIPGRPVKKKGDSYVVKPGSDLARMVVDRACREGPGLFRLCRIGIALHSLADTWSHREFTGRCHRENDVESIKHRSHGRYQKLGWENVYYDMFPRIGHAEAGLFPDYPYLEWKYRKGKKGKWVERDNPELFLDAAQVIYGLLRDMDEAAKKPVMTWDELEPKFKKLFAYRQDDQWKRCRRWIHEFHPTLLPKVMEYDRYAWRYDALRPLDMKSIRWDRFSIGDFRKRTYRRRRGFENSSWVMFHKAARRHRNLVARHIPR